MGAGPYVGAGVIGGDGTFGELGATGGAGGDGGDVLVTGCSGFVAGPGPLLLMGLLGGGGGGRVDGRGTCGTALGICGVNGCGVCLIPLWITLPSGGVTVCFAGLSGAGGGAEGRCESLTR